VGLLVKELTADCRDAAIIMAAQKIEHYEIATYGSLCSLARRLGLTHELALLRSNLYQERMADSLLTGVGKGTLGLGELIKKTSLKKAGAAQAG
jgi:ferritin-like metal-binding protein YciE